MKKLNVTWDGVFDSTGYLFSFAKSLSCAVKCASMRHEGCGAPFPVGDGFSPELAEDIVASSGFAFRMWVSPDLCPSATSIWQFDLQKSGVENGGLQCHYIERLWGQDDVEEARRQEAIALIRQSIDSGIPAISWDIGVCEWGLVIGYDDETEKFAVLPITGREEEMDYARLGKRELPILSVLTITGRTEMPRDAILNQTVLSSMVMVSVVASAAIAFKLTFPNTVETISTKLSSHAIFFTVFMFSPFKITHSVTLSSTRHKA